MQALFALTVLAFAAAVFFAALPQTDLAVSGLFWDPVNGFWRANHWVYVALRDLIRWSGDLAFLLCLIIGLANAGLGQVQRTGWRVWLFLATTVAAGPGLLVNVLLKGFVGRARPANITQFGGPNLFTPAFQITDQCSANCSFTSGEASMVAALAIPVCLVLWRNFEGPGRSRMLAIAVLYVGTGSGLRVATGRHFLSDVVFSVLFTALIAVVAYRLFGIATARRRFHLADIGGDLRRIAASAKHRLPWMRASK